MARPARTAPKAIEPIEEQTVDVRTFTEEELLASVQESKDKSANIKLRHESYNPPKFRNFKGKDYSNSLMSDYFESKEVKHGDFTGANLDGADFTGFNLQGCIFTGASVNGANFSATDLRWSNFNGCDYRGKAYFGTGDTAAEMKEVDGITR